MAYLKSTVIGGKLNVIGTIETNALTMGSTTVTGIASSITSDATKLATAKAVYDYLQNNKAVISTTASGKTVTTTVTTGGWIAKSTTSSASVGDASGYSLSITNKGSTTVTVGSENTSSSGSGYYPLTTSLTGTLSASTAGWFSSGSATDSSVVVGRIAKSTTGSAVANTSDAATLTLDPGKQTTISAGYYGSARIIRASVADAAGEAVNCGTLSFSGTDKSTTNVTVGKLSSGYYPLSATVSGTVKPASAGWITTSGASVEDTSVVVGRIAAGGCTVAGGGLSGGGLSGGGDVTPEVDIVLSAQTTSGVTIQDDAPKSGYYLTIGATSGASKKTITRAAVTRAAITDKHTAGYIPAKNATTVIAADNKTIAQATTDVNIKAGSKTEYIVIPAGSCVMTGGDVTAKSSSDNITGSNVTFGSNTSGISVTSSGSVTATRASVTNTQTAGYIAAGTTSMGGNNYTLNYSGVTQYLSAITVPSGKTFATVTNNSGTITNINVNASSSANAVIGTLKLDGYSSTYRSYITTLNMVDNAYIGNAYGSGTIYTGVTSGTTAYTLSTYTIRGVSSSYKGTLSTLNVNAYGVITTANVAANGVITTLANAGTITTINGAGAITTLGGSGTIGTFSRTGKITTYTGTGTITTMTGSRTITNLGSSSASGGLTISNNGKSSSYKSTVTVTTNTYGTVNVNGGKNTAGGVTIANKVVSVSTGTANSSKAVTNSSGNLITGSYSASGTAGTGSNSGATVTIPFTPTATIDTAGYLDTGSKNGTVVNGTYTMPSGSAAVSGGGLTKGSATGGSLSGGGLTKGSATGGSLSGGGLTISNNYSGTPTVDIKLSGQTTSGITITDTKPSSGYYLTIGAESSALSGTTKVSRAKIEVSAFSQKVTRAKVDRAIFSQTVTRAAVTKTQTAGYISEGSSTAINSASETVSLAAGSLDSASETVSLAYQSSAATSASPKVTVNKGSKTEYIVIPTAVITNGFVTGAGYIPDDDAAAYVTQYNSTDDCVDILFSN